MNQSPPVHMARGVYLGVFSRAINISGPLAPCPRIWPCEFLMADRPDSARASAVRLRILESVRCAAAGFLSMAMSMGIQKILREKIISREASCVIIYEEV